MKPLSLRAARALFPPKANPHLADQDAADQWNRGALSPRQRAGFYEIAPSTTAREKGNAYPAAIARYRERLKLIAKVCQWRRAHPQPEGGHWVRYAKATGPTMGGWVEVRSRNDSPPEMAVFQAAERTYQSLSKKQRAAGNVEPPVKPPWVFHETWMGPMVGSSCPGCAAWAMVSAEWASMRIAAFAKLGVELDPNERWHGQEVALWPDGSWSGECLNYPALPIRSAKAVPRIKPKETK